MQKPVKYLVIAVVALLALLLIGAGIIAARFNPNDYKPLIIRLVQEKQQRTLRIPGDIKLSFFPKIGADLGKVSISAKNSDAEFAAVEHARVSLALIPLLSKRLVVDRVQIDGLRANITRFKDGSSNADGLLGEDDKNSADSSAGSSSDDSEQIAFDIDSVDINNAHVVFDDRAQGRIIELAKLDVETGRIADGVHGKLQLDADVRVDQPQVKTHLAVKTGFTMERASKRYVLDGLDVQLKGSAAGITDLVAKISGALTADMGKMQLASPQLTLALSGSQSGQALSGSLTTPLAVDLQAMHVELPKVAADFTLPNPGGGTARVTAAGNADLQIDRHKLAAALKGNLDGSPFDAKFGMNSFTPAAYTFDVDIDRLDLDRYRSKPAPGAAGGAENGKQPAAAPEKPIDLSALKNLQANGHLKIGALKVAGINATNVRVGLQAHDGKLAIDPLAASLYGGSASGMVTVAAAADAGATRFTLKQTLSGINLGPLLKDALDKQPIDGKGNVQLDVSSVGATVTQLTKGLNGSARVALRDGAVHGVNIAQTIRSAKARIGALRGNDAAQSGTATGDEKTDFSELSASFRIAKGVAHNDDLSAKSPLVRIGGSGDIDLGAQRVDYLARVTVVASLQGQGGPELQALNGLTVPVKLSGPFSSIGWHVDFAGIASGLAKQKLDQKKEEMKSQAEKALGAGKTRLQDQLKGRLNGLFGK